MDAIIAPEETAPAFEGNARDKAVYYSAFAPGALVIADDSGLEVDALEGAPGVRSARYAADAGATPATAGAALSPAQIDAANNRLLLLNLDEVPQQRRSARYRCVLALARDGEVLLTAEGTVEGRILLAPQGSGGFGYDPLFHLPELDRSMAEVGLEAKHEFSHRGRAFRALLQKLILIGT